MQTNDVRWGYGDVVILKNKEKTAVNSTDNKGEASLQGPIEGEDFYSINLKTSDDLIILGPKPILETYKQEYENKVVYIEELSIQQRQFLNVPKHL